MYHTKILGKNSVKRKTEGDKNLTKSNQKLISLYLTYTFVHHTTSGGQIMYPVSYLEDIQRKVFPVR